MSSLRVLLTGLCLLSIPVIAVACDDDAAISPVTGSPAGEDGGASEEDAEVPPEKTDEDAGSQADAEAGTGAKTTSTEVIIGGVARTLVRAQFGITKKDDTFYVEAHEGGVMECPEKETPKRTLVVSGVPKGAPGTTFTKADGVAVSLLDFTGDQITTEPPIASATTVSVTLVASEDETSVDLEVDASFADGTAKGHIHATYCVAMSE